MTHALLPFFQRLALRRRALASSLSRAPLTRSTGATGLLIGAALGVWQLRGEDYAGRPETADDALVLTCSALARVMTACSDLMVASLAGLLPYFGHEGRRFDELWFTARHGAAPSAPTLVLTAWVALFWWSVLRFFQRRRAPGAARKPR